MKAHDVHGVGNALVDLQVRVEPEFLERLGLVPGTMTLVDEGTQAATLEALASHHVNRCSGGSAANTIAGIADLGGTGSYSCKVGPDALGDFYLEDLRKLGVQVNGEHRAPGTTGTSLVLITPDAQRTMLTHLGVSSTLAADDIDADAIRAAQWLYIEGYLLPGETTRAAALAAVTIAKEAGVKVALTASDPWCVQMCRDLIWQLLDDRSVDLLFCNEIEGRALAGETDPIAAAHAIHRHAVSVALTHGAKGSILVHEEQVYPIEGVDVEAVDTTGAGDMYAAGVLYGLTHGLGWAEAGRLASHAAARVVSAMGARLPRRFTDDERAALMGAS